MREKPENWQMILAQGFASATALLKFLTLPSSLGNSDIERQFKTRVPQGFANRMNKGDPNDPLLLQVLACEDEWLDDSTYSQDPLQEKLVNPVPGLIHKYHGRVLLTVTSSCAINCRYCFRRHFPYQDNNPGRLGWMAALNYIRENPTIHEVILSGGDPLLAKDVTLFALMDALGKIPHLNTLRIHTRIPVVLPERISDSFIVGLASHRLKKVVVLHTNHSQELDASVAEACLRLKEAGCMLLNQSVLLKGVNDNADVLATLSHRLFSMGVMPYYLHLLDKVKGAKHFDLPLEQAQAIYRQLQTRLPGYLVPKLAREEAHQLNKTLMV